MVDLQNLTAIEILRSPAHSIGYVFEAVLNNVGSGTWEDEDWVAGDYAVAEVGSSFSNDSSRLLFSSKHVKHPPTGLHRAIGSDLFYVSRINEPFDLTPYPNFGGLSLIVDARSPIKDIYYRRWEAGQFRVLVGGILNKGLHDEMELAYSDYKVLFSGQTKTATRDERAINPTLAPEKTLDIDFPPSRFKGTGRAEGDANLKGKPKPFMIGKPLNVTPINLGNNVYMYFDSSVLRGVDQNGTRPIYRLNEPKVRNDGVAMTLSSAALPNFSNNQIINTTVPDGEFIYNDSLIKVGGEVGEITVDASGLWDLVVSNEGITGLPGGGTEVTQFEVESRGHLLDACKRIVEGLTEIKVVFDDNVPSQDVYINDYVLTQTLSGEISGWYQTERTTLRQFISTLLSSAGYLMLEQLDGTLLIKKREAIQPNSVVGRIPQRHILEGSESQSGVLDMYSEYVVHYRKNWTTQSQRDLPSAVKVKYSSKGESVSASNFISAEYEVFDQSKEVESPFTTASDAQALANTISKDGRYRESVSFTALNEQWKFQGGDIIQADLKIMPNGLFYELLAVKELLGTNITEFEAIAYG